MPGWSLCSMMIVALAAPGAGDRAAAPVKARAPMRIVDVAGPDDFRLRPGSVPMPADISAPPMRAAQEAGRPSPFDRAAGGTPSVDDQKGDCLKTLLRNRFARRGTALDARVEWRLTGDGSDVGLGGGLARVVALLHD